LGFWLIAIYESLNAPTSLAAEVAVVTWKAMWKEAIIGLPDSAQQKSESASSTDMEHEVNRLLEDFGNEIVQLAEPIWYVQQTALSRMSYMWFYPQQLKLKKNR
jgi:hypothetical protein